MAREVCFRRLMNFFNAIGVASDDTTTASVVVDSLNHPLSHDSMGHHFVGSPPHQTQKASRRVASSPLSAHNNKLLSLGRENNFNFAPFPNDNNGNGTTVMANDPQQHLLRSAANYNFSSLKLEKLKALILDQASELNDQKLVIEEQQDLIDQLKEESAALRKKLLIKRCTSTQADKRLQARNLRLRKIALTKKPKALQKRPTSQNVAKNEQQKNDPKYQLEIIRLGPTSSKIRRVQKAKNDKNLAKQNEKGKSQVFIAENIDRIASLALESWHIDTPSWHVINIHPSGTLEGTEDITDDAYLKRHQKLYSEEKRLIRRDRLRERELELYRRRSSSAKFNEHKLRLKTVRDREEIVDQENEDRLAQIEAIEIVTKINAKESNKSSPVNVVSGELDRRLVNKKSPKSPVYKTRSSQKRGLSFE